MKDQEQKSIIIPFRVTPAEKEKIEEMSYGHYKLMSDFIRECIFKKDIIIIEGADKIADELRRIGNNINQLTKAANAGIITVPRHLQENSGRIQAKAKNGNRHRATNGIL